MLAKYLCLSFEKLLSLNVHLTASTVNVALVKVYYRRSNLNPAFRFVCTILGTKDSQIYIFI